MSIELSETKLRDDELDKIGVNICHIIENSYISNTATDKAAELVMESIGCYSSPNQKLIIQNVFDILMYIKQNVDGKGVDSLHAYDKLVIADIEAYYDNKVANIPIMLQVKNILKLRKDYKIILRSIRTNRKSELCLPNNYFDRNIHGSEILKVGEIYEFEIHEPIPGMDNELVHVYSLTNDIKNFNLFYERPITIKDIRR